MSGKLYIGNLSYTATNADLEQVFSAFGNIEEVKIIEDRETGRSRGFAFVTFVEEADAERAVNEANGTDVKGRAINVSIARERTPGNERGGFGGGGGGGGRRGSGGGGGRGGFDRGGRDNRSW